MKWVKIDPAITIWDHTGCVKDVKLSNINITNLRISVIGEIVQRGRYVRVYHKELGRDSILGPIANMIYRTDQQAAEAAAEIRKVW